MNQPDYLNVPDDLKALLEKRNDGDRRKSETGAADETAEATKPAVERRSGKERRQTEN